MLLLQASTCLGVPPFSRRREDVNIIIVMRAMGVESDEEVLQLVGTEGAFANLLIPTLQHCKEEGVYTRQQALDYLASKVKSTSRPGGPGGGPGGAFQRRTRSKVDEAREILANVVLCHVPVVHFDYQQKVGWAGGAHGAPGRGVGIFIRAGRASRLLRPGRFRLPCRNPGLPIIRLLCVANCRCPRPRLLPFAPQITYIAVMMRRMLYAMLDPSFIDDRDYYGNKRLELAGGLLALLFEDLFKRWVRVCRGRGRPGGGGAGGQAQRRPQAPGRLVSVQGQPRHPV